MSRIGLALAAPGYGEPHDIYFTDDGNLATVRDAQAVGQHARQRLMMFEGEWFIDTSAGVPWLSDILGNAYDPTLAEAVTKAELLDTDGVTEIESFSVRFTNSVRRVSIAGIDVLTIYDEVVSL